MQILKSSLFSNHRRRTGSHDKMCRNKCNFPPTGQMFPGTTDYLQGPTLFFDAPLQINRTTCHGNRLCTTLSRSLQLFLCLDLDKCKSCTHDHTLGPQSKCSFYMAFRTYTKHWTSRTVFDSPNISPQQADAIFLRTGSLVPCPDQHSVQPTNRQPRRHVLQLNGRGNDQENCTIVCKHFLGKIGRFGHLLFRIHWRTDGI